MTHCDLLLEALADGQPKTHKELYRLNIMVHSRAADLRRKGYQIACWTAQENGERVSVYQLVSSPDSDPLSRDAHAATSRLSGPVPSADCPPRRRSPAAVGATEPAQLSIAVPDRRYDRWEAA